MSDTVIICPRCDTEIELSEALAAQFHAQFNAEHQARLREAVAQAEQRAQTAADACASALEQQLRSQTELIRTAETRETEARRRVLELEQSQAQAVEKMRVELEERLRREADARTEALVAKAGRQAREDVAMEKRLLEERLGEERKKREAAQQAELALRKEKCALEERARELDLEVARRVDGEKLQLEQAIRKSIGEEQSLKLKEKDKLIEDLREALDYAKRKSEQGSQERQGEVLELDIQAMLERQFPHDLIAPVPKGVRGADLIQEVRDGALKACGRIIWETKNTRHWQPGWLDKLKQDQRAVGANLAVLVSVALPGEIAEFGQIDGVWIASLRAWPALALALREQLIQVAFAHAASEGKHEKMEFMYRYLAGDQFRSRVQGIVDAFTALQDQLNRERRAMESLWRERGKQIERVIANTVGMYGEMRGIVGASLPEIPALALEGALPAVREVIE